MAALDHKEELQERAQMLRAYEANCGIDYPSVDDLNFRRAISIRLGMAFGLKEVKDKQIAGPVTSAPQRPLTPTKR